MLEPQNKRRQGRVLHQVLELQTRERQTVAITVFPSLKEKELNWQTQGI